MGLFTATSARAEVVAIVHPQNPAETMTLTEVRLLFSLYRRSWVGGVRVSLSLPEAGTPAMRFLSDEVFRKRYQEGILYYYRTAVFQHRIAILPPTNASRAATRFVRSEPGAIALIERSQIDDAGGLQIIQIRPD